MDRVEKHLDLSNYLGFLHNLFSLSTSDSEEDYGVGLIDDLLDGDDVIAGGTANNNGDGGPSSSSLEEELPSASSLSPLYKNHHHHPPLIDPFLHEDPTSSSTMLHHHLGLPPNNHHHMSSSTSSNVMLGVGGTTTTAMFGGDGSTSSLSSASSPFGNKYPMASSSGFPGTDDEDLDQEGDDDVNSIPMPISDSELNNLLKKTTNYLGGSDPDLAALDLVDAVGVDDDDDDLGLVVAPRSTTNAPVPPDLGEKPSSITTNPSKKKVGKKKKKKSKKKDTGTSPEGPPRQNRPNSGGRGNGSNGTGSGGSSGIGAISTTTTSTAGGGNGNAPCNGSSSSVTHTTTMKTKGPSFTLSCQASGHPPFSDEGSSCYSSSPSPPNFEPIYPSRIQIAKKHQRKGGTPLVARIVNSKGKVNNSGDAAPSSHEQRGKKRKGDHSGVMTMTKPKRKKKRKNEDESNNENSSEGPSSPSQSFFKKVAVETRHSQYIELMNEKRRAIYTFLAKKEVPKAQRTTVAVHKDVVATCRRVALACSRAVKQKLAKSQGMNDANWRDKSLTVGVRNMDVGTLGMEEELQKGSPSLVQLGIPPPKKFHEKLNVFVVHVELYSHRLQKSVEEGKRNGSSGESDAEENKILEQLSEDVVGLAALSDLKSKVKVNVHGALEVQQDHTKYFNIDINNANIREPTKLHTHPQPSLTTSITLKNYQLRGMTWISRLYEMGVNGILADSPGLGKTVQSLAFLAHIAEHYGIWGPFLIVVPLPALTKWQKEIERLLPSFKLIPYWGNPRERKTLRQFWQSLNLHTPKASFHVVLTTFNVVVQDWKLLNKVKWQYLIAQEGHVQKPNAKWKALMTLNSHSRLLLAANPFSTVMGEMWCLLHFVMPSIIQSSHVQEMHISEWFTKDSESMQPTTLDKGDLQRLHEALRGFVLRRLRENIEDELCDKMELILPCPMTTRQRMMHLAFVKKAAGDELLKRYSTMECSSILTDSNTSGSLQPSAERRYLMNLIMQFRKVCNHPDLFERRDVKSPFFMEGISYILPRLLSHISTYRNNTNSELIVYHPTNVHNSLFHRDPHLSAENDHHTDDFTWSFIRFSGLSLGELWSFAQNLHLESIKHAAQQLKRNQTVLFNHLWGETKSTTLQPSEFLVSHKIDRLAFQSETAKYLLFTSLNPEHPVYSLAVGNEQCGRSYSVIKMEGSTDCRESTSSQPTNLSFVPLFMPKCLFERCPKVKARVFFYPNEPCSIPQEENEILLNGYQTSVDSKIYFASKQTTGLQDLALPHGWSNICIPEKGKLILDSGKLSALDSILDTKYRQSLECGGGCAIVIYSTMPNMLELLEEYLRYRKYPFKKVMDGKLNVNNTSSFRIFLVNVRATGQDCGLGHSIRRPIIRQPIDTIIFHDFDWTFNNDCFEIIEIGHRLAQLKPLTVYRLYSKGTAEERLIASEKCRITKSGSLVGNILKPIKAILSFPVDEEDLDKKCRSRPQFGVNGEKIQKPSVLLPINQNAVKTSSSVATETSPSEIGVPTTINNEASTADNSACRTTTQLIGSGGSSLENSSPSSIENSEGDSDEVRGLPRHDMNGAGRGERMDVEEEDDPDVSEYYDDYARALEWTDGLSDYEEEVPFLPKNPKLVGRGTGKRGRPPSRVRMVRDLSGDQFPIRRGPGRPRLRPIGPLNQGVRGRRPGRPPLTRKSEPSHPLSSINNAHHLLTMCNNNHDNSSPSDHHLPS